MTATLTRVNQALYDSLRDHPSFAYPIHTKVLAIYTDNLKEIGYLTGSRGLNPTSGVIKLSSVFNRHENLCPPSSEKEIGCTRKDSKTYILSIERRLSSRSSIESIELNKPIHIFLRKEQSVLCFYGGIKGDYLEIGTSITSKGKLENDLKHYNCFSLWNPSLEDIFFVQTLKPCN